MKELERFNKDVAANKEMQEEIKEIGNDLEKIVAYANAKGYDFTVEDVKARAEQGGELSDEQLEDVAGGGIVVSAVAKAIAVF